MSLKLKMATSDRINRDDEKVSVSMHKPLPSFHNLTGGVCDEDEPTNQFFMPNSENFGGPYQYPQNNTTQSEQNNLNTKGNNQIKNLHFNSGPGAVRPPGVAMPNQTYMPIHNEYTVHTPPSGMHPNEYDGGSPFMPMQNQMNYTNKMNYMTSQQQQMMNNQASGMMMMHQQQPPLFDQAYARRHNAGPIGYSSVPSKRSLPYPNPMYMANKRQQNPAMLSNNHQMQMVPHSTIPNMRYMAGGVGGNLQGFPSQQMSYQSTMMRPSGVFYQPGVGRIPHGTQPSPNMFHQSEDIIFHHNQVPGGVPTPPLTPNGPGSVGIPFNSPSPCSPSMAPDATFPMAPPSLRSPVTSTIRRLTFSVKDGILLSPFRLEHNLAVSNHPFHLNQQVYETLMWRHDMELQLKCFHNEDRSATTNWPISVLVSVNAKQLLIERHPAAYFKNVFSSSAGINSIQSSHQPLYLKNICNPGRNTIQITVSACCCSHLFVLQLVHRPNFRTVLQGLIAKRCIPLETCINKIKKGYANICKNSNIVVRDVPGKHNESVVEVSLRCPLTFKRIVLPSRGRDCKHLQCFDLEAYLLFNSETGIWRCPVCGKLLLIDALEIDQFMLSLLQINQINASDVVTVDQNATTRPFPFVKGEATVEENCGNKDIYDDNASSFFPASSLMIPDMRPWTLSCPEGNRSPNVYEPPDINSILMGQYPLEGETTTKENVDALTPNEYTCPLSHMSQTINNIDRQQPLQPSCYPAVTGPKLISEEEIKSEFSLDEINFDPTAMINLGNSSSEEIPLENVDPDELLSFLEPPANLSTPPSSSSDKSASEVGHTEMLQSASITSHNEEDQALGNYFE